MLKEEKSNPIKRKNKEKTKDFFSSSIGSGERNFRVYDLAPIALNNTEAINETQ